MKRRSRAKRRLPSRFLPLFWDIDARSLDLVRDRDFVCSRLLQEGGLAEVKFLRSRYGDAVLRKWMVRHDARGMSPNRIRFWQLLLEIPERKVAPWLRRARRADSYQLWLKSRGQRPTADLIRVTGATPY